MYYLSTTALGHRRQKAKKQDFSSFFVKLFVKPNRVILEMNTIVHLNFKITNIWTECLSYQNFLMKSDRYCVQNTSSTESVSPSIQVKHKKQRNQQGNHHGILPWIVILYYAADLGKLFFVPGYSQTDTKRKVGQAFP